MSNVNHPSHYNQGRIEVIEYLEDQFMDRPHEWNAVKYLSRSGRKDPNKEIEDLEKAVWYINRKIELLKARREGREITRPNAMNPRKEDSTSATSASSSATPEPRTDTARDAQGTCRVCHAPLGSYHAEDCLYAAKTDQRIEPCSGCGVRPNPESKFKHQDWCPYLR